MKGIVKWFSKDKGFGFVTCEDGTDYFLHCSEIKERGFTPEPKEPVEFNVKERDKGPAAVDVVFVNRKENESDDPRVECPGCKKKIRPNIRYYRGDIVGSICPYCLCTVKEASNTILWWSMGIALAVAGFLLIWINSMR